MRVLAGTERGLVDAGSGETLLDGSITALTRGAGSWWAIVDGHRILTASEKLDAWGERTSVRGVEARCILAVGDGALAGTSEAHLLKVNGGSATRVRSFDRVSTRDSWYTPWGGPPDTRSLTRDADGRAYANVHVGGILSSDDGETGWSPTAMDVDADVHQVLAHPTEPGVAFAATAIGLATTRDAGTSWNFSEDGLHAAYCRAVAVAGDALLLSASTSHTGKRAALYRRPLDGDRFERCTEGLPEWFADNLDTYCLDAHGERAALGTTDGLVFVSEDAGRTWSQATSGLATISVVALDG
ncbi:MAG: WD40/YVTN/BNR-like repeat-containing protein [Actinomycetota bacterium]